ncbi:MAG: hypothetical protein WCA49_22630 [Candidatus Sulfotelmatobacter sp.]
MKKAVLFTEEEYLLTMRERIDELKARGDQPRYKYAEKEQAKVIAHFIDRGIQLGEAAFRIRNLPIPLDGIMRILSDDLIRLFWISESEGNAAEYVKTIPSEYIKMMRANLEAGYGRLVHKPTGQNATAEFLPKLAARLVKRKPIEQIAMQCGLGQVYEMPFRFGSLSIHGNTYPLHGAPNESEQDSLRTLPAINAFLRAIARIVDDYPDRHTTADEILKVLRITRNN